ncbi:MAG: carboxypeptidase regulatory-like domain-containing protein [Pyrinomonadaceae bacterium]|nr:carboxypeptidase regulatory-like domain-containing protein [Pyrinomonadaceae bacterium]
MTWRFSGSIFTLAVVFILSPALLSSGQDVSSSSKKPYVSTGDEAVLSGSISFAGTPPKPRTIDMWADPVCYQVNPNPRTEDTVVKTGKLANVFVYVRNSSVLDSYTFELPTSSVVLERKGCRYVPHVLGLRVGQLLTIQNSDPTQHNTHPTPTENAEWNQTQPPGMVPLVKTFSKPETFIPMKCNQHPWEKAYLGVFSHPFFAVSDESGNYRIEGLPPGQYTVVAWHERLGEKTVDLTFIPGEQRDLSLTFDAADH